MVLSSSCAVGRGGKDEADEAGLPAKLAEPARPLQPAPDEATTATTPSGQPVATTPGGGPTATTATTRPGSAPTTTTVPFTTRLDLTDRTGDLGLQGGKPHGDAVRFRIDDDGTRGRFTLELAATIPAPLPADEQLHVGVDLDQGGDVESEYQLFAQGNSDGWRAWRTEGEKTVEYRGTFEVGANRLVFTVPWAALGGRTPGKLLVRVEWDKAGAVLAEESRDLVPDRGQAPYQL